MSTRAVSEGRRRESEEVCRERRDACLPKPRIELRDRAVQLPVRDVTRGLARKDFYIPGSILRTELDTTQPIAKGMPQQSIAWFESGPVLRSPNSTGWADRSVPPASAGGQPRSSMQSRVNFGSDHPLTRAVLTCRTAYRDYRPTRNRSSSPAGHSVPRRSPAKRLVEFTVGKGKIICFGFRRSSGQSLGDVSVVVQCDLSRVFARFTRMIGR
jgi:hypothetical protein